MYKEHSNSKNSSKHSKRSESTHTKYKKTEFGKFIDTDNLHPVTTLVADNTLSKDTSRYPSTDRRTIQRAAHTSMGFRNVK